MSKSSYPGLKQKRLANKHQHKTNLRSESARQNSMTVQAFADDRSEIASQNSQIQQMQASTQTANNTGLPDKLKSGMENLSGYSMDDVKVHYNSDKPAQLQAHAYAQRTDIHLAPGQEKHLPHEAWHVIQQKQGRVEPTRQMKGKVNLNDDAGLEKEADVMGAKALQFSSQVVSQQANKSPNKKSATAPVQSKLVVQAVISLGQQQVINNGSVHRNSYMPQDHELNNIAQLAKSWGGAGTNIGTIRECHKSLFCF